MDALASCEDVAALTGDVTMNPVQCDAMLASASARFRSEARNDFTIETTAGALDCYSGLVRLTRGPVREVVAAHAIDKSGLPTGEALPTVFDGRDTIRVDIGWVADLFGERHAKVHVEWKHGFDPIPEDVRWAVAAMVVRASDGPPAGVTGETIGSYTWQAGGYTASGALSMTRDELAVAHSYRISSSMVRQI
jgi:hypothetical protein